MKMIGNLKELSEQINTKKIKGYVSCSQNIKETGYIEITGVNTNNWWITTGKDFMQRNFPAVLIHLYILTNPSSPFVWRRYKF